MKRHVSLHPLSRHHHHGLVTAHRLQRAGQDGARGIAVEAALDDLAAFWPAACVHFREEEEILLPCFARHADPDQPPIVAMLLEHVRIRAAATSLLAARAGCQGAARGQAGRAGDHVVPVTAASLRALGDLLETHIRREERVIFPLIEGAVPEVDLQRIAPLFSELT